MITPALLDANTLYSAVLRDVLVTLATFGIYEAHWSDQIHEEWMRNLALNRPDMARSDMERTRRLMEKHVPNASVSNYEHWIEKLTLPDADDRHVLAAAIQSRCSVIVTSNLKDFPRLELDGWGIIARNPDDFLASLWPQSSTDVLAALANQRARLRNPALEAPQFLANLRLQGLTKFVALLEPFADQL